MTGDGVIDRRTRIGAYGLVFKEQAMLLCRLSAEVPGWEGSWTLPGGGIDFGEAPEAAMIREVEEETGLTVRAEGVAFVGSVFSSSTRREFRRDKT